MAIVNERLGKLLQQWILFSIGIAMIVAINIHWWQEGGDAPWGLSGLALILVGLGHEVARWFGRGN